MPLKLSTTALLMFFNGAAFAKGLEGHKKLTCLDYNQKGFTILNVGSTANQADAQLHILNSDNSIQGHWLWLTEQKSFPLQKIYKYKGWKNSLEISESKLIGRGGCGRSPICNDNNEINAIVTDSNNQFSYFTCHEDK